MICNALFSLMVYLFPKIREAILIPAECTCLKCKCKFGVYFNMSIHYHKAVKIIYNILYLFVIRRPKRTTPHFWSEWSAVSSVFHSVSYDGCFLIKGYYFGMIFLSQQYISNRFYFMAPVDSKNLNLTPVLIQK